MTACINQNLLYRLLVVEGVKTFNHHGVDDEINQGIFNSHRNLIKKIAQLIEAINLRFTYSRTLSSTLVMAVNQIYDQEHFPRLTSLTNDKEKLIQLEEIMNHLTCS